MHALLDVAQHLAGAAVQELHGALDIGLIGFVRYQVHTGRRAASYLMQQARPGAVGINAVFTGAQAEYALQNLDGFTYGPGIGIRPEIPALAAGAATVIGDARYIVAAEHQIGIRLVVPEKDVVTRLQTLDEVVFQQQRLGFGARDGYLQPYDPRHHMRDARTAEGLLEIRIHALL